MVSSFKEKVQNKYIRFCVISPPRSRIDPSHFRKIKLHPARDRVEHCIVNTVFKYKNEIVPGNS